MLARTLEVPAEFAFGFECLTAQGKCGDIFLRQSA